MQQLRRNFQVVSADASGKILTWDTRTGGVVDSYSLEDPIHISHIQVRGGCPCAFTQGAWHGASESDVTRHP